MKESDALIVGSPVYYGQPNGAVLAIVQRLCYSAGGALSGKPAAAFAVCRRGGATASFQTMNMPFMMMNMPGPSQGHGRQAYARPVRAHNLHQLHQIEGTLQ